MNLRRYSRLMIALACAALWAAGLPVSLHAQSALAEAQVPARYAQAIEFARILMTAVMEESGTPGMSVAPGTSENSCRLGTCIFRDNRAPPNYSQDQVSCACQSCSLWQCGRNSGQRRRSHEVATSAHRRTNRIAYGGRN